VREIFNDLGVGMTSVHPLPKDSGSETQAGHQNRNYKLRCLVCDNVFDDDGFVLQCAVGHIEGLLVTDYKAKQFGWDDQENTIYRHRQWLPIVRELEGCGRTITYRSPKLNALLGFPNLWIAFNGYWPEKGATLQTGSFKELEASSVLSRIPANHGQILVVASAGNTAAAFARMCSENGIASLIVVAAQALDRMQFREQLNSCVRVVCLGGSADYYDAITLAGRVSIVDGFFAEGGVRNVARRDGLGTTLLNAVETIGRLPDYYFQAVGSGTGGIAVHEAAKRLVADKRFGHALPKLMLGQNAPFSPMYDSWKSGRRELAGQPDHEAKERIRTIVAGVLSNRKPCYSMKGGVYDALAESRGEMLIANNQETLAACQLFQRTEGIDIDPAAGVALATLAKASAASSIPRSAFILLNITGGGSQRLRCEKKLVPSRPALVIAESELNSYSAIKAVVSLFG
jgi:cysteate synthase